jgi:hypothetical protein
MSMAFAPRQLFVSPFAGVLGEHRFVRVDAIAGVVIAARENIHLCEHRRHQKCNG